MTILIKAVVLKLYNYAILVFFIDKLVAVSKIYFYFFVKLMYKFIYAAPLYSKVMQQSCEL